MGVTKLGNRKFRARYSLNGKRYNVGTFKTAKEAHAAIGEHYWNNPEMMKQYQDTPVDLSKPIKVPKSTLTERVKSWLSSVKRKLEERNLL